MSLRIGVGTYGQCGIYINGCATFEIQRRHWFRYLRKIINEHGTSLSRETIDELYSNELLTPFQRVSLKAAFREGTETRKHIISLNQRVIPSKLAQVRHGDSSLDLP